MKGAGVLVVGGGAGVAAQDEIARAWWQDPAMMARVWSGKIVYDDGSIFSKLPSVCVLEEIQQQKNCMQSWLFLMWRCS